jgi:monofunctional glycosyltransferase
LRVAESVIEGKAIRWKKDWVSLEEISSKMQAAVIAAEDQYFFEHKGVDWKAIEKAMEHNRKSRRTRGASTITQQVAKNVFLWPDRSWIRKGLELYFTGLIEVFWTKQRILEVYLNVVELGDGVYGVEAAAQAYFRKHASKLNSDESALLAASLPNPRKLSVSNPSGYLRFRQSLIRRRLNNVKFPKSMMPQK